MSSAARTPPRYVPTLTEVVYPVPAPVQGQAAVATTPADDIAGPELPGSLPEQMVHRVMQRVDVLLEQRLREAITTVVQQCTASLEPLLREEIEYVVRQSVSEAMAEELVTGRVTPG